MTCSVVPVIHLFNFLIQHPEELLLTLGGVEAPAGKHGAAG